jgi:hypothetical protein
MRDMRRGAVLLAAALLSLSCGGGSPPSAVASPSQKPPPASTAPSSPSTAPLTGPYGLVLSAGTLQLINVDATVAATASVAAPSVQFCSASHDGVVMAPPVSATSDQVYFRDGDTKIRKVVLPASAADVTTVPGGPNIISFFSVSPDDQRIAVLVEDLSGAAISLRLYVEDLIGHGHHADIFTTTTAKGKGGVTLWPMGWHDGTLVLAVIIACTFEPAGISPSEWHVVDASTAVRKAAIGNASCVPSYWPSAAGVACVDHAKLSATTYNWAGQATGTRAAAANDYQSALSPSGGGIFFTTFVGIGAPPPSIRIIGRTADATVPGHTACLWIDDGSLLAPDAVIQFPSGKVLPIPASGVCAGRFPGGL